MGNTSIAVLVFAVAFVVSAAMFPLALRFARRHGIVDCPNAHKLQRVPVPVFGGVVVYLGIVAGCLVLMPFMRSEVLGCGLLAMIVMLAVGMWDNIRDIPATLRLLVETVVVLAFIGVTGVYVDTGAERADDTCVAAVVAGWCANGRAGVHRGCTGAFRDFRFL